MACILNPISKRGVTIGGGGGDGDLVLIGGCGGRLCGGGAVLRGGACGGTGVTFVALVDARPPLWRSLLVLLLNRCLDRFPALSGLQLKDHQRHKLNPVLSINPIQEYPFHFI
jgi:hypothetical protein